MKNYIIYNAAGKILRTGSCSDTSYKLKAGSGELIMEGVADDVTQKIEDEKVIDKTPEEIAAENPQPVEIPFDQQRAIITNEQHQNILNRLEQLEKGG